jgi:hypothetical protein
MPNANDAITLQALFEGVDQHRNAIEQEWGHDRLIRLAGDELLAKFRRQQARWSRLLQDAWQADPLTRQQLDDTTKAAGAMKRAWSALAEHAIAEGARPIAPWVWETRLADGIIAAFVEDDDAAAKVRADGRYVVVYTAREVGGIIDALPAALQMAKVVFPGAKVLPESEAGPWRKYGDEIPFGDAA